MARTTQPNSPHAVAHSAGKTFKIEYLGKFETMLEIALDHEPGCQLGAFSEITLDIKSHATVPLRTVPCFE